MIDCGCSCHLATYILGPARVARSSSKSSGTVVTASFLLVLAVFKKLSDGILHHNSSPHVVCARSDLVRYSHDNAHWLLSAAIYLSQAILTQYLSLGQVKLSHNRVQDLRNHLNNLGVLYDAKGNDMVLIVKQHHGNMDCARRLHASS